jgi:hypothetical protein
MDSIFESIKPDFVINAGMTINMNEWPQDTLDKLTSTSLFFFFSFFCQLKDRVMARSETKE